MQEAVWVTGEIPDDRVSRHANEEVARLRQMVASLERELQHAQVQP
jgi:hypothetical protein